MAKKPAATRRTITVMPEVFRIEDRPPLVVTPFGGINPATELWRANATRIGSHHYCYGVVRLRRVSEDDYVLVCDGCHARVPVPPGRTTIGQMIQAFLEQHPLPNISPEQQAAEATALMERRDIKRHAERVAAGIPDSDVMPLGQRPEFRRDRRRKSA